MCTHWICTAESSLGAQYPFGSEILCISVYIGSVEVRGALLSLLAKGLMILEASCNAGYIRQKPPRQWGRDMVMMIYLALAVMAVCDTLPTLDLVFTKPRQLPFVRVPLAHFLSAVYTTDSSLGVSGDMECAGWDPADSEWLPIQ